jgi:NDP-sugar pyrophosphorylase family protein
VIIVIPMAGEGLRFKSKGIATPKPLIPIRGRPMFLWAIKNLPQDYESYVFICLKEHIDMFGIDRQIKAHLSDRVKIVVSDQATEGQACTVLLAESLISNGPLLIHNADTFFECDMSFIRDEHIDGAIPYFESNDSTMSFLKFGRGSEVVEVAEKKPISTHATIGLYYFSRGSDFLWAAKEMIHRNIRVNNEFYVGPVYNYLIDRGDMIIGVPTKTVWDLGTPTKVEHFENFYQDWSKSFA